MSRLSSSALVFALALHLLGCHPPTLDEVSGQAATNTANLLGEAWDAAQASTNFSPQLSGIVGAVNLTLGDLGRTALSRPTVPARAGSQQSFDDAQRFLKERVFISANVESSSATGLTFLINGHRFCTDPTRGTLSPDCDKAVDDLAVRIVVSGDPNARLTFDFQFGPQKVSPLTLVMEKDKALELTVRLADYQRLLDAQLPGASTLVSTQTLSQLEGELRLRLEKRGPLDFVLSLDVTREVRVAALSTDGLARSGSLAPTPGVYRLHFNGLTYTQEASMALGALAFAVPAGDFWGGGDVTPFTGTVGGLGLSLSTEAGAALATGRLDVQPMHAAYGTVDVASVAFTAPLDLELSTGTDGRLSLTASEFDATADFHFAAMPRFSGNQGLANEHWHLGLRGAPPTFRPSRVNDALAIKLTQGQLTVEAAVAQQSLAVSAGQCFASGGSTAQGPLGALSSVACP